MLNNEEIVPFPHYLVVNHCNVDDLELGENFISIYYCNPLNMIFYSLMITFHTTIWYFDLRLSEDEEQSILSLLQL